jgi:hypothetical protein
VTVSKPSPEKPERDLDEWDAEIEAEFQRVTQQSKAATKNASPKRKKWQRLGAMVPREWEQRLKRATRVSTYRLALELLSQQWCIDHDLFSHKGDSVIVSEEVGAEAGLSKRSVGNALGQLEQLGLIEVVRSKGRAPRATLLHILRKPE